MPDEAARYERIYRRLGDLSADIQTNQIAIAELREDVADLIAELGGVIPRSSRGNRPTVRDRMHVYENDKAAAKAAQAALEASEAARKTAEASAWTKREKGGLFLFAAVACLTGLLRFFGFGL